MNNIIIKKVTSDELETLQNICRQTFAETFATYNTDEDMKIYLQNEFSSQKLKSELNDINTSFYFAVTNRKVIGYLKINIGKSQTEIQHSAALEIERIYILKEFHGKGVGQLLYNKALKQAQKMNADYVWLGVWEKNERAIHFYKKNGFIEFDQHIFKLGNDKQIDIMMKHDLNIK